MMTTLAGFGVRRPIWAKKNCIREPRQNPGGRPEPDAFSETPASLRTSPSFHHLLPRHREGALWRIPHNDEVSIKRVNQHKRPPRKATTGDFLPPVAATHRTQRGGLGAFKSRPSASPLPPGCEAIISRLAAVKPSSTRPGETARHLPCRTPFHRTSPCIIKASASQCLKPETGCLPPMSPTRMLPSGLLQSAMCTHNRAHAHAHALTARWNDFSLEISQTITRANLEKDKRRNEG